MKSSLYLSYSSRSLLRGGQRTALAVFCIAVGVMAIVALQLASESLRNALTGDARALNGGDVSITATSAPVRQSDLAFFNQLKSQGVISGYSPQLFSYAQINAPDGHKLLMQARLVDPATFPPVGAPHFDKPSGGSFKGLLSAPNSTIITASVAKALNVSVGDRLDNHLQAGASLPLTVAGIIANDNVIGQGDVAFASLDAFQKATGVPPAYSYVGITTPNPSGAARAADAIRQQFPLATVRTPDDLLKQNEESVNLIRRFLSIVGLLALLIGGVGIVNTMQVLLSRRRVEIAMLKTAGYRRQDLYLLFGLEAAALGLVGGIIGALLGVAVSSLVLTLFERATQSVLPFTFNAITVVGGVAIGFATALIFGLLPIVRSATARPIAVLRELPENTSGRTLLQTAGLLLLLSILFFLLAWAVLGSPLWAAAAVYGGLVFLGLLSLGLGALLWVVERLPIPDRYSIGYLALVSLGLAIALAILAVPSLRGVGVVIVVFALLGYVVVLLPRPWKMNGKLALRNVGRSRARATTTLLALFIGVFVIGVVLAIGQDLKTSVTNALANQAEFNLSTAVPDSDGAKMDAVLKQISGIEKYRWSYYAPTAPQSVNGASIADRLPRDQNGPGRAAQMALQLMNGAQGYSLASGDIPTVARIPAGRNLTAADDGSTNVIVPDALRTDPPRLAVGDTLGLINPRTGIQATVTVVGFYKLSDSGFDINLNAGPVFGSQRLAQGLAGADPRRDYFLRVPTAQVSRVQGQIQQALPGVFVFNFGDLADLFNRVLSNFVVALTAIGALALLAGVIIVANAVAIAMLERRRELGMLKALGYTSGRVLSGVLLENGLTAGLGGLLGMVLVALAVFGFGRLVKTSLDVSAPLAVLIIAGVVALAILTALLVAWNAVRLRPLEVLRYE